MLKDRRSSNIILWFISHPWLKLIALILAILVWFYAKGEMQFNY